MLLNPVNPGSIIHGKRAVAPRCPWAFGMSAMFFGVPGSFGDANFRNMNGPQVAARTGTATTNTWGSNPFNNLPEFVAAGDRYFSLSTLSDPFSLPVSMWCVVKMASAGVMVFIEVDTSATNNGYRFWSNSGALTFTFGGVADYALGITISANQYYLLACTVDKNVGTATGYAITLPDLVLTTGTHAVGTMSGTPNTVQFGANQSGGAVFAGRVQTWGFHSRVLSATEVFQFAKDVTKGYRRTFATTRRTQAASIAAPAGNLLWRRRRVLA